MRDFYANVYPEITSADIEGPQQVGGKQVYTFRRAVGTKGASAREVALLRLRESGRLASAPRPANILTQEQARATLANRLQRLIELHRQATGPRCLAPSVNQVVLP